MSNTHDPDFDVEFYIAQNSMMKERYAALFKKRGLSWKKYLDNATFKLKRNVYYIWTFLCGLDTFLKQTNDLNFEDKKNLYRMLYKDAEERIYRILGDDKKIEDYIRSL